mgnify:FL=1
MKVVRCCAHSFAPAWVLLAIVNVCLPTRVRAAEDERPPNFVFILCDNLGYGDWGCFGSTVHRTPHIDRLAADGVRLTHFYSTSGVCTPSRASLMTGCYPRRVGMHQNDRGGLVLQPVEPVGLNPHEVTIAEVLQSRGYATALVGKWHLGDQPKFLPTRHGFDEYFGIPYSDDMTPREGKPWPPLPLVQNERVIEAPVDRTTLTRRYTERTIEFIQRHKDRPFFICLAHAMPGSTRAPFASERFQGKSANGPWGDSVEEIDWSTGEIVRAVRELDLDRQTIVVMTSDNGAPKREPPQGSNAPLGGWGYTTAEGGMRVPCIVRWTDHVPAGTECAELSTMMDWLPTFAHLAAAELPSDRIIDGRDILPLLKEPTTAKTPHEAFYYYQGERLEAVRAGEWKLYVPKKGLRRRHTALAEVLPRLYNVIADPAETQDEIASHPEIVERLKALAGRAREDLGDGNRPGKGQRPPARIAQPQPLMLDAQ